MLYIVTTKTIYPELLCISPKGLRVFLLKIASKQSLLKASRIAQNLNKFWYFQP
jgi:hypothetical protein